MVLSAIAAGLVGCSGSSPKAGRAETSPGAAGSHRAAAPTVMSRSRPVRLRIPAIHVRSTLMPLGLKRNRTLEVPPSGFPAGWYTGSPTPGERGPAVIVGHVDWKGRYGVFHRLYALKHGDRVMVSRADGEVATFAVTSVRRFAKNRFPTELVYGDIDRSGLRLITCGGYFDRQAHSYEDNIVAFAELVPRSKH